MQGCKANELTVPPKCLQLQVRENHTKRTSQTSSVEVQEAGDDPHYAVNW